MSSPPPVSSALIQFGHQFPATSFHRRRTTSSQLLDEGAYLRAHVRIVISQIHKCLHAECSNDAARVLEVLAENAERHFFFGVTEREPRQQLRHMPAHFLLWAVCNLVQQALLPGLQ